MRVHTSDGKSVDVSRATARASQLLVDLADSFDLGEGECPDLNMPNVSSANLSIISEFCDREEAHHKALTEAGADRAARDRHTREHNAWKERFLETIQADVPSLMTAANFLHVECVIEACSVNIAEFIKKRTPEEIREYFKLQRCL